MIARLLFFFFVLSTFLACTRPPAPPAATPAPPTDDILAIVRKRAACLHALDDGATTCAGGFHDRELAERAAAIDEGVASRVFAAAAVDPDPYVGWVGYQEVLRRWILAFESDHMGSEQPSPPPPDPMLCRDRALATDVIRGAPSLVVEGAKRTLGPHEIAPLLGCIAFRELGLWDSLAEVARTHEHPELRGLLVFELSVRNPRSREVFTLARHLADDRSERARWGARTALANLAVVAPEEACPKLLEERDAVAGVEHAFAERAACEPYVLELVSGKLPEEWYPAQAIFSAIARRCTTKPLMTTERAKVIPFLRHWADFETRVSPPQGDAARIAFGHCRR